MTGGRIAATAGGLILAGAIVAWVAWPRQVAEGAPGRAAPNDEAAELDVLLIVVDALRADAVLPGRAEGTYPGRAHTPFLDALLAGSHRFTRAYAQSTCARPSLSRSFRSIGTGEELMEDGAPSLGAVARRAGLVPIAVLPPYFDWKEARHMHADFERVTFYDKRRQEQLADRFEDALRELEGQRVLTWLHFYCLHEPVYSGRRPPGGDLDRIARYDRALEWLDGQLLRVHEILVRNGRAERTAILFTADHGENLVEGAEGHGFTVKEAEIRVPLAIRLPGETGGVIDATVGNIDIPPTLLGLFGLPAEPAHRGRDLVAVIAGEDVRQVHHAFDTSTGDMQGVVLGRHKLVRTPEGDLRRYDLDRDPLEHRDVHGERPEIDRRLLALLPAARSAR